MKTPKGSTTSFAVDSNTDPNNLSTFQSNITVGVDESLNSVKSTISSPNLEITDEQAVELSQGLRGRVAEAGLYRWTKGKALIDCKLSKTAEKIILQMRGVTLTPEDADAIVEEIGHVAHGWSWGNKGEFSTKYSNLPTVIQIVNGVVTPTLQVLLYDVLGVIDASIPNKDQNRAVKNIIRNSFDKAYIDILRESCPDSNFTFGPGHSLEPSPDKSNAILSANLKA
jgi:hypothetical protein